MYSEYKTEPHLFSTINSHLVTPFQSNMFCVIFVLLRLLNCFYSRLLVMSFLLFRFSSCYIVFIMVHLLHYFVTLHHILLVTLFLSYFIFLCPICLVTPCCVVFILLHLQLFLSCYVYYVFFIVSRHLLCNFPCSHQGLILLPKIRLFLSREKRPVFPGITGNLLFFF